MRIIGIDVGGTNTDATLLSEDEQVLAMAKVPTNHHDIFASTKTALEEILQVHQGSQPVKLQLSTTLSTNAIVEGTGQATAVLAIPGPGLNLQDFGFDFPLYTLQGYIDHRGRIIQEVDEQEVISVAKQALAEGAEALAIVGKFSQRNSRLEKRVKEIIEQAALPFEQLTLGHQLSGRLNFPRRIVTAYFNARVTKVQTDFAKMIEELQAKYPLIAQVQILKADGGTMSLAESCQRPVETILSGPAASIMAAQALSSYQNTNQVVVDIGGTTTDIAIIVGGESLQQRNGAEIGGWKTLVPGLLTYSLGLGGDSEIHLSEHGLKLGPRRAGTPVALGGNAVTPTDAAVALGLTSVGQRNLAIAGLSKLTNSKYNTWQKLAEAIVDAFVNQLCTGIKEVYQSLENVPVYTVSEILAPPDIRPRVLVGLGAPASVFIPLVGKKLALPYEVLPYHAGANGIGAAASRVTVSITLHADTERELLVIPELGLEQTIRRNLLFDLKQAREIAVEQLTNYAKQLGIEDYGEVQIAEEEVFNMVRGFHTVGRIFHLRAQIRPKVYPVVGEKS